MNLAATKLARALVVCGLCLAAAGCERTSGTIVAYSAGTGISIQDEVISADLGTGAGQVARGEDVAALQSTTAQLAATLTTQAAEIQGLLSLPQTAAEHQQAITDLNTRVTNHESSIADQGSQLTSHSTAIADLQSQLTVESPTVNVRHFGAKGDGTTDDSAAIQAAVDHAGSLAGAAPNGTGVEVYFPTGTYLVQTSIRVPFSGLGFRGPAGRGAKITGDTLLFDVGDYTDTVRVSDTEFESLLLMSSNTANATAAIKLYRTTNTLIHSCVIQDFSIHIDCYRASTTTITMNRFSNGRRTQNAAATLRLQGTDEGTAYSPGGGMHVSDNEFVGARKSGNTELNCTAAHILVHSVDGLYLQNNHYVGAQNSLRVEPLATAANHVITDIMMTQEYYDEPCSLTGQANNVVLTGTAGSPSSARYQNVKFAGCLFRASNVAANGLRVAVAGGALSDASALKNVSIVGGTVRQAVESGIAVLGSSSSNYAEVRNFLVEGVYFADNNSGGSAATSGIAVEAEGVTLAGNTFAADANPSARCIQVTMSDNHSGMPSAVVAGNDFSGSNYSPDPAEIPYNNSPVRFTVNKNARLQLSDNLFAGSGKLVDQVYRRTTTDATPASIFEYQVPETSNGELRVRVVGSSDDGTVHAAYEWQGAFVNGPGAAAWSAPVTTVRAQSAGGAIADLSLNTNTLQARVTGVAATTLSWACHVEMLSSK